MSKTLSSDTRKAIEALAHDYRAVCIETEDDCEALSDMLHSQDAALLLLDLAHIALLDIPAQQKRNMWRASIIVAAEADDEFNGAFVLRP